MADRPRDLNFFCISWSGCSSDSRVSPHSWAIITTLPMPLSKACSYCCCCLRTSPSANIAWRKLALIRASTSALRSPILAAVNASSLPRSRCLPRYLTCSRPFINASRSWPRRLLCSASSGLSTTSRLTDSPQSRRDGQALMVTLPCFSATSSGSCSKSHSVMSCRVLFSSLLCSAACSSPWLICCLKSCCNFSRLRAMAISAPLSSSRTKFIKYQASRFSGFHCSGGTVIPVFLCRYSASTSVRGRSWGFTFNRKPST